MSVKDRFRLGNCTAQITGDMQGARKIPSAVARVQDDVTMCASPHGMV